MSTNRMATFTLRQYREVVGDVTLQRGNAYALIIVWAPAVGTRVGRWSEIDQ